MSINNLESLRLARAEAAQARTIQRQAELNRQATEEPETLSVQHPVLARPPAILAALLNRAQGKGARRHQV